MEDWFGKLLGVIALVFILTPPRYDPLIRAKAKREWPEKDWGQDRGFSNQEWSLFVAVIAIVVMLAVVFAISVSP